MAFSFKRKKKEPEPESGGGEDSTQKSLERPSAEQIYRQVLHSAADELKRSSLSLAISAYAGGIFMGLSALGTAIALGLLPASPMSAFCARLFYPLGFIVVILGRAQLFTENTLYPVALVLATKKHLAATARLWAIVLPMNVLGALTFAALVSYSHALEPRVLEALVKLGVESAQHPAATVFWSGVMGGWIIATVAWLVSGSHSITGSVMIIWMLTFVVGLGGFAHCIAASGELLSAVLTGHLPWQSFPQWFLPAVCGNICGGVGMVTLLEYGQVIVGGDTEAR